MAALPGNTKRVSRFVLTRTATATRLRVWLDGKAGGSGSQLLRGVIYGQTAQGLPGQRLTRSFQVSVAAGQAGGWVTLYLAPGVALNPGSYWLGLHAGPGSVARFGSVGKIWASQVNGDAYADDETNPFGPTSTENRQLTIYAYGR